MQSRVDYHSQATVASHFDKHHEQRALTTCSDAHSFFKSFQSDTSCVSMDYDKMSH